MPVSLTSFLVQVLYVLRCGLWSEVGFGFGGPRALVMLRGSNLLSFTFPN